MKRKCKTIFCSESTNELKYSSNYSLLLWNRLLSFSWLLTLKSNFTWNWRDYCGHHFRILFSGAKLWIKMKRNRKSEQVWMKRRTSALWQYLSVSVNNIKIQWGAFLTPPPSPPHSTNNKTWTAFDILHLWHLCTWNWKLHFCVTHFFLQTFQTWNRANILASLTMKLSYAGEMLETNLDFPANPTHSEHRQITKLEQGRKVTK